MTPSTPKKSFRTQIGRVLLISLGLSLGVLFVSVYYLGVAQQQKWMERDIAVLADILGNRSVAALDFYDQDAAKRNLVSSSFHPAIDFACLYNRSGELFAYFSRTNSGISGICSLPQITDRLQLNSSLGLGKPKAGTKIVENAKNDQIYVYSSVTSVGDVVGELVIVANTKLLKTGQRELLLILLVLFVVVMISALLVSRRMLSSALSPLTHLHNTAKNISVNSLSRERVKKISDDEVGELVDVFNAMLNNLAKENEALVVSESRFRTLAESAPIGIFLRNENFETLYVNDRWCAITGQPHGCSRQEYLKSISDYDLRNYEGMIEGLRSGSVGQTIEYRYRAPGRLNDHILMEYVTPLEVKEGVSGEHQVRGYVGSVLDVTELKNAQHELEKLAYYDPLTHLPNRRYFKDYLVKQLQLAKEEDSIMAVLLVDLDNFKRINDTLGHDAGDILLSVLAGRIKQRLHSQDLVARMGGDEFYLVLRNLSSLAEVEKITKRVRSVLASPIRIKNHFVEITASIGVASYPENCDTPEELMRNADIALYKAKGDGRNRVAYFSAELDSQLRDKMRLESKLRQAVSCEAFEIYIQPQYDYKTSKFRWAEVLIRWEDPEEGFIPPDKFIKLAEETGIINDIDQWVLRATCKLWAEHGEALRAIGIEGVSMNLSARQFYSKTLFAYVEAVFDEYGINPSCISFEITESMVIENIEGAIETMERLRNIGSRISIDDFGTGYSSLSYLKRLPIDSLKIDRSFIMDIPGDTNDVAITSAIIAMAEKLNLSVIAEGIETKEQCEFLVEQGCFHMQGYYFAKPAPVRTFLKPQLNAAVE